VIRDISTSGGPPRRLIVCGLVILAGSAVVTYVTIYVGTYASATLGLPPGMGFVSTVTLGVSGLVCSPLGGWLSDRLGRKPVMIGPWLLLLVAALPGYQLVVAAGTLAMLVAWTALVGSCAALAITATLAALAEGLPPSIRSRGLGLIYAFAIAMFGGSTQFVVAWLSALTGSPLAPAWYMTGAVAIAALAMAWTPETAGARHPRAPAAVEM
jgi:MFS family permease